MAVAPRRLSAGQIGLVAVPACEGNHTPLGRGRRGSIYWRPIDKSEDLEKLIEELPSKPFLVGDEGVSMSLAGVQTKLAVRRLHRLVTRQHAGDSVLLLRPIEIGNAPARWRLNQRSQPNTRAKNVSRIAWLTAAGAALKGREDRAVAAVTTDGEIGEASRQVEV